MIEEEGCVEVDDEECYKASWSSQSRLTFGDPAHNRFGIVRRHSPAETFYVGASKFMKQIRFIDRYSLRQFEPLHLITLSKVMFKFGLGNLPPTICTSGETSMLIMLG